MSARSDTATAADSSSAVAVTTQPRPAGPSKFSLPLRFTIRQLMILTAVVGLAMAPLAMIRKHDRIELIVAMVAFELIGLPALITIILLSTMKPGPARLRTIVFLCLLPTLLVFTTVGLFYLAGLPLFLKRLASNLAAGDFRDLPVLCVIVGHLLYWIPRFLARCPVCHRRGLRLMRSPPATVGRWVVTFECPECGELSGRNVFLVLSRPWRFIAKEVPG